MVTPLVSRAGSWKVRDLPPPVGMHPNTSFWLIEALIMALFLFAYLVHSKTIMAKDFGIGLL